MSKLKVAFFDFAGCEGCQLQIANLEEGLLSILDHIEIVNFREVMKEKADDYELAFVEGFITRPSDAERLKAIRKQAKTLVALGTCACIGGINALKNFQNQEYLKRYVYGQTARWYETYEARPLKAIVPVDFEIPGCPIDRNELVSFLICLLQGKRPQIPDYPVCVECKRQGHLCVLLKGEPCLGPVTRAGCKAACVAEGSHCWGCRGLISEPNVDAQREALAKLGLSFDSIISLFRLYDGCSDYAR